MPRHRVVRMQIFVALGLVLEAEESEHRLEVRPIFEEAQILSETSKSLLLRSI